ncbi:MAG: heme-binding domain-containing protein [Phototrophicales bacterium]
MNENIENTPLSRRRTVVYSFAVLLGVFGLMQFARFIIPDFKLDNPPVTHTVNWDSPETERLWNVACADCHSNETVYPWYSYVAPVGWLVAHDTHEGRSELNVSTNHRIDVEEMIKVIREGEMPPPIYTITHVDARLSDAEKQALIDGIQATFNGNNTSQSGEE